MTDSRKASLTNVAASIVTYKTDRDELSRALGLLKRSAVERVTVVDNSPDDSLRELVISSGADYIKSEKNLGYGAAHNIALRRSLSDQQMCYHLVMNSDISFDDDTLGRITAFMNSRREVGQLIPRMVYPDGRIQASVRLLPTPLDLILRRFLPRCIGRKSRRRFTLADWSHDAEANIPYHQGSFMFFRLDALRQTGLFDERFFMYPEDVDITRRIHERFVTLFWPGATIVHDHRAASYRSLKMLGIHVVNMARYFNKWGWFYDPARRKINRAALCALGLGKQKPGK